MRSKLFLIILVICVCIPAASQSPFKCIMIDPEGAVRPWGKCFGDLNNDGLKDLIIGGYTEGGLVYYANPEWEKVVMSDEKGFSTDIEVFDIDGDNDLDVFCVRGTSIEWFENPGWESHMVDRVRSHDLELADIDNDGKIDIVARDQGEFRHRGDTLFIYRQITPDSWEGIKFNCADGEGLKLTDINSDSRMDILINGYWFENTGDMHRWNEHSFTDTWNFKSSYIDVGDINGDGRDDIVLTPSELAGMVYRTSWFEAPPDPYGIWTEHIIESNVEAVHHFVGLADFDLDGNLDVATAEMLQGDDPDEVKIYYNYGSGDSWEKLVLSNAGCHSMRIVDIDDDGDMDLFGANHNDRKIRLWMNQVQHERNLLTSEYSFKAVKKSIIPSETWEPFPTIEDRDEWESIPANIKNHYISEAEESLGFKWPPLPATIFMEFKINGNRSNYQALYYERRNKLVDLVLAEMMEGNGRFLDDITNGIWSICEETYWGVPAHLYLQRAGRGLPDISEPTVDLFAAETGALLAWTVYLLGDRLDNISQLISQRVRLEANRRILTPCLERNDFWWMGLIPLHEAGVHLERLNNWSPWICSNWLTTVLLLEEDADRRTRAVYKIMGCIDNYMNPHPEDGGCDEGPSYWNHAAGSLLDCLELLYNASGEKIDIYDHQLVSNMGKYIYRAYIGNDYYINFADASAVLNVDPGLVFRYGQRIGDENMMAFAGRAADKQNYGNPRVSGNLSRQLLGLFSLEEIQSIDPEPSLVKDVWLEDLQVMAARSNPNSERDFYIAAKGGHNHESHNHNDVGNFIVYLGGNPVLIDVGVETYTKKTFDPVHRYEIWTMQSAYHNLPTINGVMQMNGLEFKAQNISYDSGPYNSKFSLDISSAYPEEAAVKTYMRTIVLNRDKNVSIKDRYVLEEYKEPIQINLMTPLVVDSKSEGEIILTSPGDNHKPVIIHYDENKFDVQAEKIKINDGKLHNAWGNELNRIILTVSSDALEDEFIIQIE